MGCKIDCCQPCGPTRDIQKLHFNMNQDQTSQETDDQDTTRKGFPSNQLAVRVDNLMQFAKDEYQQKQIQTQVFRLRQHQKQKIKPLKLNIASVKKNELSEPYYLPHLQAFYVGEWVYNKKYKQNIPKGIGRLYTKDWIFQGNLQTFITSSFNPADQKEEWTQIVSEQKKKSIISSIESPDNLVLYVKKGKDKQKDKIQIASYQILLNGQGRKINKIQQFTGQFVRGVLEGKGTYINNECSYEYTGSWKNGFRHGKGLQKSKTFSYQGDFENDEKQGEGVLLFNLDKQRQHQIRVQDAQIRRKLVDDDSAIQDSAEKSIKRRKRLESAITQKLSLYQWKNPFYKSNSQSSFQSEDFYIERQLKNVFPERYSGTFSKNQMDGKGTYQWFSGKKFHGQWKKGRIQGVGQFYWPDGTIYRGQYKSDMKHGKGEIIWCQTRRFRGSWAFGVRHGYGQSIQIRNNTIKIKGALWKKDNEEKIYFENTIDFQQYEQIIRGVDQSVSSIARDIFDNYV